MAWLACQIFGDRLDKIQPMTHTPIRLRLEHRSYSAFAETTRLRPACLAQ